MYDERIDQHAGFLEALAEKKFNMGIVACIGPKVECVSIACALGWTPNTFPELVRWQQANPYELRDAKRKKLNYAVSVEWRADPRIYDHDAMERLFDLSQDEVSVLFGTGYPGYHTPKEVAKGLRFFAKTRVLPNTEEYLDMLRKEQRLERRRLTRRAKEVSSVNA